MKDLAITWWGQSGNYSMLLELDSTGAGTLVLHSAHPKDYQSAYRIRGTRLAQYDIAFELEPVADATKDLFLRGHAYRGGLDLKMGSRSLGWKDAVEMIPWGELTAAIDALKHCRDRIRDTGMPCD